MCILLLCILAFCKIIIEKKVLTLRCASTQHRGWQILLQKQTGKMNSFEDGNKAMLVLKACINPVANFKINFIGQHADRHDAKTAIKNF